MNIFYVAIVFAVIFLILAVALFFVFNIPVIIGSLTGRTSKREIKKIIEGNQISGLKKYKSSIVNEQRGKVTDKIVSGELVKQQEIKYGEISTDKLAENETTLLNTPQQEISDKTTVLYGNIQNDDETTVLSDQNTSSGENTTVLGMVSSFEEEEEISFSESNEIVT